MIKIVKPVTLNGGFTNPEMEYSLEKAKNPNTIAIFLAGPCPREDYTDDWRNDLIHQMYEDPAYNDHYTYILFNPTNDQYNEDGDPDYYLKQVSWEVQAMRRADSVLFWIPRSKKHPALTTNVEFGEWMFDPKTVVGMPPEGIKNKYLKARLQLMGKKYYETLRQTIHAVVWVAKCGVNPDGVRLM